MQTDIKNIIEDFHNKSGITERYASFDICFTYFHSNRNKLAKDMERSCLYLWSYLASWGMLRGSSDLLQKSPVALIPLIEHFSKLDNTIWELDVDKYNLKTIPLLIKECKTIKSILENKLNVDASDTLITKILMGVVGCIPAYDTYFTETFRNLFKSGDLMCAFRNITETSLLCIKDFYDTNEKVLNSIHYYAMDFNGNKSSYQYTKAKLIDMFGFNSGINDRINKK